MTAEDISLEEFRAFVQMRDSGRFNMMTQCAAAAAAEGISVDKHIKIIINFEELAAKYEEVFEELAARYEEEPAMKPVVKPWTKPVVKPRTAAKRFEPDETPNCGYAKESFVVQRRIPAVEKAKNWRDASGDLPSYEQALAFIEDEKRIRTLSNGPKRVFRIVKKHVEASILFESAE